MSGLGDSKMVVAVQAGDGRQHPAHSPDVRRAFHDRIKAGRVGESVKVDRPVEPATMHFAQQFQRGLFMYGANHQAVVPLGVAIVQMQSKKAGMALDQGCGECGLFVRVKGMGKVERDAKVCSPDFADRSLNSNLVLRWEYASGSALYVVWKESRFDDSDPGRLRLTHDLGRTFRGPATQSLSVKADYRLDVEW